MELSLPGEGSDPRWSSAGPSPGEAPRSSQSSLAPGPARIALERPVGEGWTEVWDFRPERPAAAYWRREWTAEELQGRLIVGGEW